MELLSHFAHSITRSDISSETDHFDDLTTVVLVGFLALVTVIGLI